MDAMKPFWCFFVVAILSEGHAPQNQTLSQYEYESWNWNPSTPMLHSGHKV